MKQLYFPIALFLIANAQANKIIYSGRRLIPESVCAAPIDSESLHQIHPNGNELMVISTCDKSSLKTSVFIVSLPDRPTVNRLGLPSRKPIGGDNLVFAAWDRIGNLITFEPGSTPESTLLIKNYTVDNQVAWTLEMELDPKIWMVRFDGYNNMVVGNLAIYDQVNGNANLTKINTAGSILWSFGTLALHNNIGFGIRFYYRFVVTEDGYVVFALGKTCCPAQPVFTFVDLNGKITVGEPVKFAPFDNGAPVTLYNETCAATVEMFGTNAMMTLWCRVSENDWQRTVLSPIPRCQYFVLVSANSTFAYLCENPSSLTFSIAPENVMSPSFSRTLDGLNHQSYDKPLFSLARNRFVLQSSCVGSSFIDGLAYAPGTIYWLIIEFSEPEIIPTKTSSVTTLKASSTVGVKQKTEIAALPTGDASSSIPTVVGSIFGALSLIGILVFIYIVRLRHLEKKRKMSFLEMTSKSRSQHSTVMETTSSTSKTSTGFTLPSFLEIDSGKCMRKKKIISTSGAGSVFLVDIVDQQLSAMYKTNQAIAKIADGSSEVSGADRRLDRFMNEVSYLYYFHHRYPRNFVEIFGYDKLNLNLMMRYYKQGSMASYRKSCTMTKSNILHVLQDVASALGFMHREGFAHCDLKSDNVLIVLRANEPRALLTDLGITKIVDTQNSRSQGLPASSVQGLSARYASPEIIKNFAQHLIGKHLGVEKTEVDVDRKASDVYSFGCILYEALTKKRPWAASK